jgi:MFS family permease
MIDEQTPGQSLGQIKASELAESFGVRRYHVFLLAASTMFVAVQGTIAGGTPYVMEAIKREFILSDASVSLTGTAIYIGSIPGVFIGGILSDIYGRVRMMIACMIITLCFCLLHFAIPVGVSSGYLSLMALRVILGLPYGAIMSIQIPLLQEYFPDFLRGSAAAATSLGWNAGVLYLLSCMPIYDVNASWRVCYALGPVAPVVFSLGMLCFIPESPRWLLTQGQTKLAQQSLNVIFTSQPIYKSAFVGQAPCVDATDLQRGGNRDIAEQSTLRMLKVLFSPCLCWTTVVSSLIYLLLAGPSNTIWTWGPLVLEKLLGTRPPQDIFRLAETFGICGTLTMVALVDRISRGALVSMAFGMTVVCMTVLLVGDRFAADSVLIAWILRSYFDSVLWCVIGIYVSEAFPTVLRGTASGLVMMCGRIASVVFPWLAGMWVRNSVHNVLNITTAMFSAAAILALGIPKETSSLPMDDVLAEEDAVCAPLTSFTNKPLDWERMA